ncbi:hypothetical protein BKA62DRAFT_454732 [Auriculariales sp. MPI-PUGE-AT-0066]|nr:hypothetical protein BKA62DRAFT_454732 [Auriculariales sp. MPI-PUGE-AT-0066]
MNAQSTSRHVATHPGKGAQFEARESTRCPERGRLSRPTAAKALIHQFHSTIPRWRVRIPLAGGLSLALKRSRQQVRAGSMRTTSLSGSDACLASADLMASSNGQRARLHSLDTSAVAMSRPTAERIKDDLNPHYRLLRKCCQRNVQPQSHIKLLGWHLAVSAGVNTPPLTFLTARCMARPHQRFLFAYPISPSLYSCFVLLLMFAQINYLTGNESLFYLEERAWLTSRNSHHKGIRRYFSFESFAPPPYPSP